MVSVSSLLTLGLVNLFKSRNGHADYVAPRATSSSNNPKNIQRGFSNPTIQKGKNFTAVLTAIDDSAKLENLFNAKEGYSHGKEALLKRAQYQLTKDDIWTSKGSPIDGFHLLLTSGGESTALIINTDDPKLAESILKTVADIANKKPASEIIRYIFEESDFGTRGSTNNKGKSLVD
ncbi:MAG: hypothetical protein HY094_10310 [Candidatus Melainabacteria bacterium]|nr:hypothetical protein [Candidatus Melainabacteria bacterium]